MQKKEAPIETFSTDFLLSVIKPLFKSVAVQETYTKADLWYYSAIIQELEKRGFRKVEEGENISFKIAT